jgi:hypothetical protein
MNRTERRAKAAQRRRDNCRKTCDVVEKQGDEMTQIIELRAEEYAESIDIGPCQTQIMVRLRNDSSQMVVIMTPDEAEGVLELLKRKIDEARSFMPPDDPVENATRILSAFEKMEKLEGTL